MAQLKDARVQDIILDENHHRYEDLGKEEIGNYYVDDEGNLIRWNGKEILFMNDAGFFDKK